MKEIVFVCTGNTCRSPMAEAIFSTDFTTYVKENNIYVCSRGLMVYEEQGATDNAILAMKNIGIDISKHISQPLDIQNEDIMDERVILTMTEGHKNIIQQHRKLENVYTLSEFAGTKGDIKDPYGGDLQEYEMCAKQIKDIMKSIGG